MGLFKKKENDNTEIVEGLKSLVERVNDFLTSGIGIDKEHKALFTQANDETKAEVEKVFGIPFDDFMLGIKNNEFQISYWGPLSAATIFLGTTDVNKLQKSNELPAILNNPLPELADWKEVFNNLLLLPSSVLNFYIARMDCSYKAKKTIMDALLKPDFASFEKCVENMGSESDLLKNVADWYKVVWGIYFVFTEGADNKNQEIMANNSFSSIEEEEGDSCRTIKNLAKSLSVSEEELTPEIISKINYENMKSIYLLNMNLYLKSRTDYLKERDSYPKEIQDIVDPYIVDPEEIEFYVELKKRGCTFDAIEDNGTEEVSFDDQVIFESERGLSGENEEGVNSNAEYNPDVTAIDNSTCHGSAKLESDDKKTRYSELRKLPYYEQVKAFFSNIDIYDKKGLDENRKGQENQKASVYIRRFWEDIYYIAQKVEHKADLVGFMYILYESNCFNWSKMISILLDKMYDFYGNSDNTSIDSASDAKKQMKELERIFEDKEKPQWNEIRNYIQTMFNMMFMCDLKFEEINDNFKSHGIKYASSQFSKNNDMLDFADTFDYDLNTKELEKIKESRKKMNEKRKGERKYVSPHKRTTSYDENELSSENTQSCYD